MNITRKIGIGILEACTIVVFVILVIPCVIVVLMILLIPWGIFYVLSAGAQEEVRPALPQKRKFVIRMTQQLQQRARDSFESVTEFAALVVGSVFWCIFEILVYFYWGDEELPSSLDDACVYVPPVPERVDWMHRMASECAARANASTDAAGRAKLYEEQRLWLKSARDLAERAESGAAAGQPQSGASI